MKKLSFCLLLVVLSFFHFSSSTYAMKQAQQEENSHNTNKKPVSEDDIEKLSKGLANSRISYPSTPKAENQPANLPKTDPRPVKYDFDRIRQAY